MATETTGGCLCGACRYRTEAIPLNVRICHCSRCQRATGGLFFARLLVPLDQVTITGPVTWFAAESGLRRGFCSQCGTALFTERAAQGAIGLSIGSLDDPDRHEPTEHIWVSSKRPWLVCADGKPHYPEAAP
ncbi:GFA family protein [Acidisoma sp. 7E03]